MENIKELLITKEGRIRYAQYLINMFGKSSLDVIDEMLKICSQGSLVRDLKETSKEISILFNIDSREDLNNW